MSVNWNEQYAANRREKRHAARRASPLEWKIPASAGRLPVTTKDLYWAAGFLDGEGCFTIVSTKGYFYPQVIAAQKDTELLGRLKQLFGGKISITRIRNVPYGRWVLTGPNARGLMLTLWSLVSEKRRAEIERCLAQWSPIHPHMVALAKEATS